MLKRIGWGVLLLGWGAVGCLILVITMVRLHLMQAYVENVSTVTAVNLPKGMIDELPDGNVVPTNWMYNVYTVGEWWWWRVGPDQKEQSRRLLKIGLWRLRSSLEMMSEGLPQESLTSAERAVSYLQEAYSRAEMSNGQCNREFAWSVDRYIKALAILEMVAPETIRPRLTTLAAVPRLMASELHVDE